MYFHQTKYCSNSDLSDLKKLLNIEEPVNYGNALNFGSLVHAHLIEPAQIGVFEPLVSVNEKETAELMIQAARADATVQMFLDGSLFEHEIYRERFEVTYEDNIIHLPFRIKLDLYKRKFRTGGDFKTTACESYAAFVQSIFSFHYDRQAAVYMDAANLDRFMFIGMSKKKNRFTKKHEIFKFAIVRGDQNYLAGKRKYQYLAFKYYFLIHKLNLQ